jgi:hypothetical protein
MYTDFSENIYVLKTRILNLYIFYKLSISKSGAHIFEQLAYIGPSPRAQ